jgi:hypothetical protein
MHIEMEGPSQKKQKDVRMRLFTSGSARKEIGRKCLNKFDPIPDIFTGTYGQIPLIPQRSVIFLVGKLKNKSYLFCFDVVTLFQYLEQLIARRLLKLKGPKIKMSRKDGELVWNLKLYVDKEIHPELQSNGMMQFDIDYETFKELIKMYAIELGLSGDETLFENNEWWNEEVAKSMDNAIITNYLPQRHRIESMDDLLLLPHIRTVYITSVGDHLPLARETRGKRGKRERRDHDDDYTGRIEMEFSDEE